MSEYPEISLCFGDIQQRALKYNGKLCDACGQDMIPFVPLADLEALKAENAEHRKVRIDLATEVEDLREALETIAAQKLTVEGAVAMTLNSATTPALDALAPPSLLMGRGR